MNKKDTQGIVPCCLLVMNMTPIDRKEEIAEEEEKEKKVAKSKAADFGKTATKFFD